MNLLLRALLTLVIGLACAPSPAAVFDLSAEIVDDSGDGINVPGEPVSVPVHLQSETAYNLCNASLQFTSANPAVVFDPLFLGDLEPFQSLDASSGATTEGAACGSTLDVRVCLTGELYDGGCATGVPIETSYSLCIDLAEQFLCPTPSPTPTPVPTASASPTASPSATASPTPTASSTPTPEPTVSPSPSASPSASPSPSSPPSPTGSPSPTPLPPRGAVLGQRPASLPGDDPNGDGVVDAADIVTNP